MTRLPAFFLVSLAVASPAGAASPAQYRAELAGPAPAGRLIVRGTVWHCGGDACAAADAASRPEILCAALAREVGTLRSFAAEGRAFAPDELEKCNARAR